MKITESERLIIRQIKTNDSEFIIQLVNSPNWLEFIGDRNITTKQQAIAYIHQLQEIYEKNGFTLFVMTLKPTNITIGLCGFLQRDYLDSADIGFAILPDFEGKGYTFEACQVILEYGIHSLKISPIYAITSPKNIRSQSVLKKLSLHLVDKSHLKIDDEELLLFELKV